ncbi:MAG: pyrroline-5-carboxylate reductase [Spirochaetales bacterium]|nr:pyrroline-5-carboxylate reductase [Spirochaetales bacterium]
MDKIGFIGAGNMAFAIAKSIAEKKSNIQINIFDINQERLDFFKKSFKNLVILKSNDEVVKSSDIVFLAVKPQIVGSVLSSIEDSQKIIISILAGVKLKTLSSFLPSARFVRVMPNTPCLVGEMAGAYSFSPNFSGVEIQTVVELLECTGTVIGVDESLMDAVTALSGSGPAFVARLIEYFVDAAVKLGLDRDSAVKLAVATFKGTAILMQEQSMEAEDLITMVTSPKGTTAAGREVLESSSCKEIIYQTLEAARDRGVELGNVK